MLVETTALKHVGTAAAAGLSWAVAFTSSIQAAIDQSTPVPLGIAVAAVFAGIGLTWRTASIWANHRAEQKHEIERLHERLDRIDKGRES